MITTTTVTIRVPTDLLARLKAEAQTRGSTLTDLLLAPWRGEADWTPGKLVFNALAPPAPPPTPLERMATRKRAAAAGGASSVHAGDLVTYGRPAIKPGDRLKPDKGAKRK